MGQAVDLVGQYKDILEPGSFFLASAKQMVFVKRCLIPVPRATLEPAGWPARTA